MCVCLCASTYVHIHPHVSTHARTTQTSNGSSGAYSPSFPAAWVSGDGLEMWMVSTSCCNYHTEDPSGYIPKSHGYQFHATPVRVELAGGRDFVSESK